MLSVNFASAPRFNSSFIISGLLLKLHAISNALEPPPIAFIFAPASKRTSITFVSVYDVLAIIKGVRQYRLLH